MCFLGCEEETAGRASRLTDLEFRGLVGVTRSLSLLQGLCSLEKSWPSAINVNDMNIAIDWFMRLSF